MTRVINSKAQAAAVDSRAFSVGAGEPTKPDAIPSRGAHAGVIRPWLLVAASLLLRFALFDLKSGDYRASPSKRYDSLLRDGRWQGFGASASRPRSRRYLWPYPYHIPLRTPPPLVCLYAIKPPPKHLNVSRQRTPGRPGRQVRLSERCYCALMAAILLFSTLAMSNALRDQCDIMRTCAVAAAPCYALGGRVMAALVAIELSFSVNPLGSPRRALLAVGPASSRPRCRRFWTPPAVYAACPDGDTVRQLLWI
jgi:hypothetical protein